jgi:hypothetical protein
MAEGADLADADDSYATTGMEHRIPVVAGKGERALGAPRARRGHDGSVCVRHSAPDKVSNVQNARGEEVGT